MKSKEYRLYLFLLPAFIMFTLFVFIPLFEGVRISFQIGMDILKHIDM